MDTPYTRMTHQRSLERDADAALRALSAEERETLKRARTGSIFEVPEQHQRRFLDLCLGKRRDAGFALTELGRCAADRVNAQVSSNGAAHESIKHRTEKPLVNPLVADWP
jgi:hypothetical protein